MPSKEKFCLEVSGDFACFTRPEMKVERVSYDVITPSAARGVFEAILWKPGISWQIESLEVLRPINWVYIRRNEVGGERPRAKSKSSSKTTGSNALGFSCATSPTDCTRTSTSTVTTRIFVQDNAMTVE